MNKKISKKSKRRLMTFGVFSIIAIVYFFITLFSYTYNYISLKKEEFELKKELIALQDKKANLKIEIEKLNDPEYVARYAKENFLYSAEGEYVIKIETNEQNSVILDNDSQTTSIISISLIFLFIILFIIKISKNPKKIKRTVLRN